MYKLKQLSDLQQYQASAWALVAANCLPLFGVLFLGWDAFAIVVLYWSENVVIGAINVLKMLTCSPDDQSLILGDVDAKDKLNRERMERSRGNSVATLRWSHHASKLFFVPFFTIHYGGFCFGHGFFIFALFGREAGGFGPLGGFDSFLRVMNEQHLWWCIAALAASHLWSFFVNYNGRGEFRRTNIGILMFQPYARIVVLHIAILIGGIIAAGLGSNIMVLLVLIVGKTILDLGLHLLQRRNAATSSGPSDDPRVLSDVTMAVAGRTQPRPGAAAQSRPPSHPTSGAET
jgi:hypothetical protein